MSDCKVTMSLNEICAFSPCKSGYKQLLKAVNKTAPDDEQIGLDFILESNGIEDAIWCFRVKWFQHKPLFMEFVNACSIRAKDNAAAAAAAAAADAADAAYAATAAAYAAYAAYATAERKKQKEYLLQLLKA